MAFFQYLGSLLVQAKLNFFFTFQLPKNWRYLWHFDKCMWHKEVLTLTIFYLEVCYSCNIHKENILVLSMNMSVIYAKSTTDNFIFFFN